MSVCMAKDALLLLSLLKAVDRIMFGGHAPRFSLRTTKPDYRSRIATTANNPQAVRRYLVDRTGELVFNALWSYVGDMLVETLIF
jgi:hypothetical protein